MSGLRRGTRNADYCRSCAYGIYTGHTPACAQRAVAEDVVESLTPARESTDEEHGADGACLLTPTPATIPASADVPTKEATEAMAGKDGTILEATGATEATEAATGYALPAGEGAVPAGEGAAPATEATEAPTRYALPAGDGAVPAGERAAPATEATETQTSIGGYGGPEGLVGQRVHRSALALSDQAIVAKYLQPISDSTRPEPNLFFVAVDLRSGKAHLIVTSRSKPDRTKVAREGSAVAGTKAYLANNFDFDEQRRCMMHSVGDCHITNMRSAGEYALSVENFRTALEKFRGSEDNPTAARLKERVAGALSSANVLSEKEVRLFKCGPDCPGDNTPRVSCCKCKNSLHPACLRSDAKTIHLQLYCSAACQPAARSARAKSFGKSSRSSVETVAKQETPAPSKRTLLPVEIGLSAADLRAAVSELRSAAILKPSLHCAAPALASSGELAEFLKSQLTSTTEAAKTAYDEAAKREIARTTEANKHTMDVIKALKVRAHRIHIMEVVFKLFFLRGCVRLMTSATAWA